MGAFYDSIPDDPKVVEFIRDQKLFHVASAPLRGGNVNVSPKGEMTFKLVNRKACWYLDLSGSGNETISHIYEPGNGRVTILFQAFEGSPFLVRLYGKGRVFERGSPEYTKLLDPNIPDAVAVEEFDWPTPEILPGARAIIWLDITKVGTSCGFSVPLMDFVAHRDTLDKWAAKLMEGDSKASDPYQLPYYRGLSAWEAAINSWSIDGLPGLKLVQGKVSPEVIRKAASNFNIQIPVLEKRRDLSTSPFLMLTVGICLGVFMTTMAQGRHSFASMLSV